MLAVVRQNAIREQLVAQKTATVSELAQALNVPFYDKELLRKIKQVDKARARTREILSGSSWGQRDAYELIVNTSGWEIKELAPVVKGFAKSWFGRKQ